MQMNPPDSNIKIEWQIKIGISNKLVGDSSVIEINKKQYVITTVALLDKDTDPEEYYNHRYNPIPIAVNAIQSLVIFNIFR